MNNRGSIPKSGTRATVVSNTIGAGGRKAVVRGNGRRDIRTTKEGIRVCYQDTMQYVVAPISGMTKYSLLVGGGFTYFKWLTNVAKSYSKYRIHNLRFGFASTCSTTSPGDITLCWVSDTNDAISWASTGDTEAIFSMGRYATGPIWAGSLVNMPDASISLSIDSSIIHRAAPWLYTGVGEGNYDNFHYAGALIAEIPFSNTTSTVSAGRIFCEYDIEFCEPVGSSYNTLLTKSGDTVNEGIIVNYPDAYPPGVPPPTVPVPLCSPMDTNMSLTPEESSLIRLHRSQRSYDLQKLLESQNQS